jgi:hypothetical protein
VREHAARAAQQRDGGLHLRVAPLALVLGQGTVVLVRARGGGARAREVREACAVRQQRERVLGRQAC